MAQGGRKRLAWDELIFGAIGVGIFGVFTVALVFSIKAIVFGIIVAGVLTMALVDYFQSIWSDDES